MHTLIAMLLYLNPLKNRTIFLAICILMQLACIDWDRICGKDKKSSTSLSYPINKYFFDFPNNRLYAQSPESNNQASNEAYNNYTGLKKTYFKWNKGLLKNKRYYKKNMTRYLNSIIGKEILTDYDYGTVSPEGINEKEYIGNIFFGRWLRIKGNIKQEASTKTAETKWQVAKKLLSVYGRVKGFDLEPDQPGEELVVLYLADITVKEGGR